MEYRNLEITVGSAKDLKNVNLLSKMDVYVVVMIAEDPRTQQKTPVDKDGGKSPTWNYKMKFLVDETAARQNRSTLVFRIKSDRALGDREIGEVYVPVKELLGNDGGDGDASRTERSASYSVRTPSGKEKGVLNLSYKVGDKVDAANFMEKRVGDEPVMAYPTAGSSYGYAPAQGAAHMYQPPAAGAPPGYPPQYATGYPQHGYPQMAPGYVGYPPPQQGAGYGYPPQMVQKPKKKKNGMGMGMGLGAGLLGGLLIGDMISDVGDMGYDDGGMGDFGGDFDF